ncbi:hypothetical protein Sme01_52910 [Sphaerisporangium melleum]|uniref:YcaO domain-containing protein n=1 Tax=Sphaerisporangium melleum TaxID=321316 RepID=A0A917R5Z1_9ACTN|nr:hypothetical protein [Sphaerisporangium melleum]GGK90841.1 hypothetical protein GCM10007964_36830 [Sphaerisporangium melleum]GII72815.1 hypothetical protein Sme01_52910 [Sphaerisporangium melleum]
MAPTPDSSPPALSPPDAGLEEVAECLAGEVHLAYAHRPESGITAVAAAFTPETARARARARASALVVLHGLPDGLAAPCSPDERELCLADFMPEPPAERHVRVSGDGLLSGERYTLPAEVVWLGDRDCRVEPTAVGVVGAAGVPGAIADLLAHDMVTRWWANPRMPLLRVSQYLAAMIPPRVAEAVSLLGLRVSAFALPGPGFQIAVVGVSGDGTTIATAAARSVEDAVAEAFLRALAARTEPWNTLPTADSLRRLTVWHREVDYLAHLEWSALDADATVLGRPGEAASSWADIACRRFGHEPVVVASEAGEPVKVVCPGAACYRTVPPGTSLPCPVP